MSSDIFSHHYYTCPRVYSYTTTLVFKYVLILLYMSPGTLSHLYTYPQIYSHTYKKLYRVGSKYELQLRVDGMTLTVDLASGCLTIKGSHVIDWVVSRFPGIMNGFVKPPGTVSKELCKQYTEQEVESLKQEQKIYYKKCKQNIFQSYYCIYLNLMCTLFS